MWDQIRGDSERPHIRVWRKWQRNVGAGMVRIAAIASVTVGLLIFGPPLWEKVIR
jgi:hypothetical protein